MNMEDFSCFVNYLLPSIVNNIMIREINKFRSTISFHLVINIRHESINIGGLSELMFTEIDFKETKNIIQFIKKNLCIDPN